MAKTLLCVAIACVGVFLSASAIAATADFVPGTTYSCNMHLATGQAFILQSRTLHWKKNETELYTTARAWYARASGEFLWWGSDYTPDAYFRYGKTYSKPSCTEIRAETLLLKDGEWALFWSVNSWLSIVHSNLKFRSIEKGWQFVAQHPNESSSVRDGKWVASIELDKVLGADFFHRPERLRYDARPYNFQALIGVAKVESTWELQIQGTEDRAVVVMDKNFRVVKIATGSANRK